MDLLFEPIGLLTPLIAWISEYTAIYALLYFTFRAPANRQAGRLLLVAFLLSVLVTTVLAVLFSLNGWLAPPLSQRVVIGRLITLFILIALPIIATAIATLASLRLFRNRTIVSLIAVIIASIFMTWLYAHSWLVLICVLAEDCI